MSPPTTTPIPIPDPTVAAMAPITVPGPVVATLAMLALAWVGMGLLCWPVVLVRLHHMMRHNKGWTWRTTLTGRPNPHHPLLHAVRVVVGHMVAIVAWPIALHEVR